MNITMNIFTIYPMGGGGILVIKSEYQNDQGCVHGGVKVINQISLLEKKPEYQHDQGCAHGGVKVINQIPVGTGTKI